MASRTVVADSDEEPDEASPLEVETRRGGQPSKSAWEPPPSPSPSGKPSQHTSSSTDPAVFAQLYENHRQTKGPGPGPALHEAIGNVPPSNPGPSASSGDLSLPPPGKGKTKALGNVSSATDITSPRVRLAKGRKSRLSQLSTGTDVTTPNKSARDEWDVPSSDDELAVSKVASRNGAGAANSKTPGKRERPRSSLAPHSSPEMAATPAAKRQKAPSSRAEFLGPSESSAFFIAPSSLTASQKEQYVKLGVSQDHQDGGESTTAPAVGAIPPPSNLAQPSMTTTVACSTPSGYAASPRLRLSDPWETAPGDVIGSSSSVNVPASEPDRVRRTKSTYGRAAASTPSDPEPASSARACGREAKANASPAADKLEESDVRGCDKIGSRRENRRSHSSSRRLQPVDICESHQEAECEAHATGRCAKYEELGDVAISVGDIDQGNPNPDLDSSRLVATQAHDQPKKRGRKRKRPDADGHDEESAGRAAKLTDSSHPALEQGTMKPTQEPTIPGQKKQQAHGSNHDGTQNEVSPDNAESASHVVEVPEKLKATRKPKKRVQKRKQLGETVDEESAADVPTDAVESSLPATAPEAETSVQETKPPVAGSVRRHVPEPKKRGRKRKLAAGSVDDVQVLDELVDASDENVSPTAKETGVSAKNPKKRGRPRKAEPAKSEPNSDVMAEVVDNDYTSKEPSGPVKETAALDASAILERSEVAAPLRDMDRNMLTESKPPADVEKAPASSSTTKLAPSQGSKVSYRVGLSKRSRIAPLLKSLKKL